MSQNQDHWTEYLAKAGVTGVVGAAASYVIFGETAGTVPVPFTPVRVPTSIAIGIAVALASLLADVAHDFVFPHILKSARLSTIESALMQIAVSAVATVGLLVYGSGAPKNNIGNMALLGAGSVIGGAYAYDKFLGTGSGNLF